MGELACREDGDGFNWGYDGGMGVLEFREDRDGQI